MDNQLDTEPSIEDLWVVVKEAHDYLKAWLDNPNGILHPEFGKVIFNTKYWGLGFNTDGGDRYCKVCLAGLWYVQKKNLLLDVHDIEREPMAEFLDLLRWPQYEYEDIGNTLGVKVPHGIKDQVVEPYTWDSSDPSHILAFLGWLLEQHEGVEGSAN